ncbi:MAG: hypothetical protein IPL74_19470 [Bacteroidetes bacterium]|nr:hypothetical protein [Bacteroidota bacterium]
MQEDKLFSEVPFPQYIEERFKVLQEKMRRLRAEMDLTESEIRQIIIAKHNHQGVSDTINKRRQIKESLATEKNIEIDQVVVEWTAPILEVLKREKGFMTRTQIAKQMKIFGFVEEVDADYLKKLSDALFKMTRRKKINSYQKAGVKGKFEYF